MTTEEKIAELEANCKAMTAELEKLKVELAEKNKTVWIPEFGDSYMYIDTTGYICSTMSEDKALDKYRIDFNNVYYSSNKTREHLNWYRDNVFRIQNKLMQLHELLCPDYFPEWEDANKRKFFLYYNYDNNDWEYGSRSTCYDYVVCFNREAAEKACEILNREKFMTKGEQDG